MSFIINEAFIHIMDKFNEKLQLHGIIGYATMIVHNCRKFRMHWMEPLLLGANQRIGSCNQQYCPNSGNWRPCENKSVFTFVTTFTDDFRFITKSGVNLQQNHQGVKVWRNVVILSSRGFNFKMSVHVSQFGIFITKMLHQCQI
jgi:hypothetical protein